MGKYLLYFLGDTLPKHISGVRKENECYGQIVKET